MFAKIVILLIACSVIVQSQNLYLLPTTTRARCLDGTQSGYYFTPGSGSGADKFLIYLEGGGRCQGTTLNNILINCYQRSLTDLGSSSGWSSTYTNQGAFSGSTLLNPYFYNWNRVYVKYCDGNLYQGSSEYTQSGKTLYFRGYDTMVEVINSLIANHGLNQSTVAVLSGGSAGGLGAYFWNQYLRKTLPLSVKVFGAPDSGLFPAVNVPQNDVIANYVDIFTGNNRAILQPEGCPYLYDNQQIYKCQVAAYILDLIPTPIFIINSLYDSYSLQNVLGVTCVTSTNSLVGCTSTELAKVDWLRNNTYDLLVGLQTSKPDWGVWAISCILHVFSNKKAAYNNINYKVAQNTGLTPAVALKNFIEAKLSNTTINNFYIDSVVYPNNIPCNGY